MKHILFLILIFVSLSSSAQVDSVIDANALPQDFDDVDNFVAPSKSKERTYNQLTSPFLTHGLRVFVDMSAHQGADEYSCNVYDFGLSDGWQFCPYFFLGIGFSAQFYADYYYYGSYSSEPEYAAVIPLFVDARCDIARKRITPFVDFRIGYAASDDTYNDYNGVYFNFSFGVRLCKANLSWGIESVSLNTPYICYDLNYNIVETNSMSNWFIKFAYEFGGAY